VDSRDLLYHHELNVLIASTLEKVQDLNPERYAYWYTKLYSAPDREANWNVKTLHTLEQLQIDYAN
jgi:hypothetical protein